VTKLAEDLPLFAASPPPSAARAPASSPLDEALAQIVADELTPKAALDLVYRLIALRRDSQKQ
jgi:DNA mismatch repair protein MutS